MGTFNRLLSATFHPPRKWVLVEDLSYQCDQLTSEETKALKTVGVIIAPEGTVTVPIDFETDMASVPRACWAFIAPFDVARAAVIHDLLYKTIRQYRWQKQSYLFNDEDPNQIKAAKAAADKIFLYAMEDAEPAVSTWKIKAAYYAVRLFGNSSIIPAEDNI